MTPSLPGDPRRIVLVRHARPSIDTDIPRTQWGLSEASSTVVTVLGGRAAISGLAFGCIACSPETKALETAEVLPSCLGTAAPAHYQ